MSPGKSEDCAGCQDKFKQTATRYYCCDPEQVFCRKCRNKFCLKCKKTHYKQIVLISCPICKWSWNQETAFQDHENNEKVCMECVKIGYACCRIEEQKKVTIIDKPLLVIKHNQDYIQNYLKKYCWFCSELIGKESSEKFEKSLDIKDLFCSSCYKKQQQKYPEMDHNFLKEKSLQQRIQYPAMTYKSYDLNKDRDYCNACGIPIFSNGFYTEYFILCESCVRMSHEAQVKGWSGQQGKEQDRKREGNKDRYMMEQDIMQPIRSEDIMQERMSDDDKQQKYKEYEEYQKYENEIQYNYGIEAQEDINQGVEEKENVEMKGQTGEKGPQIKEDRTNNEIDLE